MTTNIALVNLNDRVRVRLTASGWDQWRCFVASLNLPGGYRQTPILDAEGYCTFQVWELAQIFGPALGQGCPLPFQNSWLTIEGER